MKNTCLFLFIFVVAQACAPSKAVLVLTPTQSMCITGKGSGQDAAINPYLGSNSLALVRNVGKNSFSVRIQRKGKIVKEASIPPHTKKSFVLLKDYELYFDTDMTAKAQVSFKKQKN